MVLDTDRFQELFLQYGHPDPQIAAGMRDYLESLRGVADTKLARDVGPNDKNRELNEASLLEIAKTGFMGIDVPEKYGGQGYSYLEYAMALFEIGQFSGDQSTTLDLEISHVVQSIIKSHGTHKQKERWLIPLAAGVVDEKLYIGSFAQSEEKHGSDVQGLESTLIPIEDKPGNFVANGRKKHITNRGKVTLYLLAQIMSDGRKRLTTVGIDQDAHGHVIVEPRESTMGVTSSWTGERDLQNVAVTEADIIGEQGKGFKYFMQGLNEGRYGITISGAAGLAWALDKSIKRANDRIQSGPIIQHHEIKHKLALMEAVVLASRLMVYDGAQRIGQGEDVRYHAAVTKVFSTEAVIEGAYEALQIWAGEGYYVDAEIERITRDVRLNTIGEGSTEVLRKKLITPYLMEHGIESYNMDQRLDDRVHQLSEHGRLLPEEGELVYGIQRAQFIMKRAIDNLNSDKDERYYGDLADLAATVEPVRTLLDFAIKLRDNEEPEAERVLAMAQFMGNRMGETAARVGNKFMQYFGGSQFAYNAPQIYFKDDVPLVETIAAANIR